MSVIHAAAFIDQTSLISFVASKFYIMSVCLFNRPSQGSLEGSTPKRTPEKNRRKMLLLSKKVNHEGGHHGFQCPDIVPPAYAPYPLPLPVFHQQSHYNFHKSKKNDPHKTKQKSGRWSKGGKRNSIYAQQFIMILWIGQIWPSSAVLTFWDH